MKNFSAAARRRCFSIYGCTPEEAIALNEGLEYGQRGCPLDKYRAQRWMAEERGIEWHFTFPQWKRIWDESGKWSIRGTGPNQAYMARRGDCGPYSIENVFIAQNGAGAIDRPSPDERFATRMGCSLSDFESSDQMRLARQRFIEQRWRATQRKVGWELTFIEWWRIWQKSGLWSVRGRSNGESAVMARFGDEGPYSKENVHITSLSNNFAEYREGKGKRVHQFDSLAA